jgi:hypothetical protein
MRISVPSGRQVRHRPSGCRSTRKPWWTQGASAARTAARRCPGPSRRRRSRPAGGGRRTTRSGRRSRRTRSRRRGPPRRGARARDQPDRAAVVPRQAVGAHPDPGDRPVTGRPAGAGGGDGRPDPGLRGTRPELRVGQVRQADPDDQLGLVAAQDRQGAGGELVVAQLHQRVGLLDAGALVGGVPAGTTHSSAACSFSPPTASRSKRPVIDPSACVAITSRRPSVGSGSGLAADDLAPLFGPAMLDRLRPLLVAQNRLAAGQRPVHRFDEGLHSPIGRGRRGRHPRNLLAAAFSH